MTKQELLAEHRQLREQFRRYRAAIDRALDRAGAVAGTSAVLRIEWLAQQRHRVDAIPGTVQMVPTPYAGGFWAWLTSWRF